MSKEVSFKKFDKYIFYFIIFSIGGWIWEVIFHIMETGKFVNRGMYYGPWIPIYGFGGLLIVILLNRFRKKPFVVFLLSGLLCGTIEYLTGWLIEVTRGCRWWDYSEYILNLNGHICLYSVLGFSLIGLIVIEYILPKLEKLYNTINGKILTIIIAIISAIYLFDVGYSVIVEPNSGEGINININNILL
jgi:uncharacterized membrane protein